MVEFGADPGSYTIAHLVKEEDEARTGKDGSCSAASNSVYTNDLMGPDSSLGKTVDDAPLPFPARLYSVLEEAETKGYESIISWMPRGFKVHNRDDFMTYIAPACFSITKYKSFLRQLNLYKFQRISRGPEKGKTPIFSYRDSQIVKRKREMVLTFDVFNSFLDIYHHKIFVRGDRSACQTIKRVKSSLPDEGGVTAMKPKIFKGPRIHALPAADTAGMLSTSETSSNSFFQSATLLSSKEAAASASFGGPSRLLTKCYEGTRNHTLLTRIKQSSTIFEAEEKKGSSWLDQECVDIHSDIADDLSSLLMEYDDCGSSCEGQKIPFDDMELPAADIIDEIISTFRYWGSNHFLEQDRQE